MLFPDTVAVPTVVPPVVQLVGAEDSGPKTVTVIVPVGLALLTTVSDIPEPHVLVAELLFPSPP